MLRSLIPQEVRYPPRVIEPKHRDQWKGMTPIGSTSSNIRRAIEFIVYSSCCRPGALAGTHDHLDDCGPPTSSHNDA
jgi:hypothetical protein